MKTASRVLGAGPLCSHRAAQSLYLHLLTFNIVIEKAMDKMKEYLELF